MRVCVRVRVCVHAWRGGEWGSCRSVDVVVGVGVVWGGYAYVCAFLLAPVCALLSSPNASLFHAFGDLKFPSISIPDVRAALDSGARHELSQIVYHTVRQLTGTCVHVCVCVCVCARLCVSVCRVANYCWGSS